MELFDKAKTSNDFGLRKQFPWTGSDPLNSWTEFVTEASEISFVKNLLLPRFAMREPVIRRVQNPYLWARYVLAYEELNVNSSSLTERYVIHATSLTNAFNIAEINFDWRRVRRARFGKGVSFSTNASYAYKYASGKDVYIIAGISYGKKSFGGYHTNVPSTDCDTTGDVSSNVLVKYYDSDFYPYYIVQ